MQIIIRLCFFIIVTCTLACADTQAITNTNSDSNSNESSEDLSNQSWTVAIISDMNGSYGSTSYSSKVHSAISHIANNNTKVSLVLSTGDMVAGQKTGLDYQKMWNAFHSAVTTPLDKASIPLLPSPGNHDASVGSSFKKERDLYVKTWNGFPVQRFNRDRVGQEQIEFLPGVEQNYPLNYAVTMGPAVFIGLDATAVGPLVNDQLGWLEEVLQKTSQFKVKVVFGHVPLYPFAFDKTTEYLAYGTSNTNYAQRMENILETYNVTYYLSGHDHAFYPGHRNGNVRYISVPLLGSGARKVLTKDRSGTTSKTGFLYLTFDHQGQHKLEALESPTFKAIPFKSTPEAVSVPSSNASDCKSCGSFPTKFFLSTALRTLFYRLQN